ncbi:inositol monophosphatase 1-like [Hydra vulgaris]|uniref:Inositol-1-monophosphatase n=1 Tax=Hydra vulgaris TaxID=6087 RepID=A0ABM4DPN4_HYDVU
MSLQECLQKLASKQDCRLHYVLTAINIANNAGNIIKDCYHQVKTVSTKDCATDLVTDTDKLVEKLIFSSLKTEFPSHKFIGEESVSNGESSELSLEPTWIVDPIDGTTNFVHRNPYVAVSIGLVINKKSEVGVVYAPILNDLYVAVKNEGAYLNGQRLKIVNPPSSLSNSLIAFEWGADRDSDVLALKSRNLLDIMQKHQVRGMRSTGSAALNMCMVACSSLDLYFEWGPHCWDMAASNLMVEEAGGFNTTTLGCDFDLMGRTIISAACKNIIEEIVPTLTQIPTRRDDE